MMQAKIDCEKVLIVEDDVSIRESLNDVLEDHGYRPVTAGNGRQALELLSALDELPCAIVLDLMMPVMDGRDFRAAQLQSPRLASIPVIVLSAYRDVRQDAEQMKANAFLNKPLNVRDLLSAVERYCSAHAGHTTH